MVPTHPTQHGGQQHTHYCLTVILSGSTPFKHVWAANRTHSYFSMRELLPLVRIPILRSPINARYGVYYYFDSYTRKTPTRNTHSLTHSVTSIGSGCCVTMEASAIKTLHRCLSLATLTNMRSQYPAVNSLILSFQYFLCLPLFFVHPQLIPRR